MPFPIRVDRQEVSFEIPESDFGSLLELESVNYREFQFPVLSELIDQVGGVDRTTYSGHFGAKVHMRLRVESDGTTPQVESVQAILDDYFEDLRRIETLIPGLLFSPRQTIEALVREDGERRTILYSDENFLIADADRKDTVTVFHLDEGVAAKTDLVGMGGLLAVVLEDRRTRQNQKRWLKEISPSRDMPDVFDIVSCYIDVPQPRQNAETAAFRP